MRKTILIVLFTIFFSTCYSQITPTITNVTLKSGGGKTDIGNNITGCVEKEGTYVVAFDYAGFPPNTDNIFKISLEKFSDGNIFYTFPYEIKINNTGTGSYTSNSDENSSINFPVNADASEYYRIKVYYEKDESISSFNNDYFSLKNVFPSNLQLEAPTFICSGDSFKLKASIDDNRYTYIWEKDNNVINREKGLSEIEATETGTYFYTLELNGYTCELGSKRRIELVELIEFGIVSENGKSSNGCFDNPIIFKPDTVKVGIINFTEIADKNKLSYQWKKDGNNISSEETYKVEEKGSYSLEISTCNGNFSKKVDFTPKIGNIKISSDNKNVLCSADSLGGISEINLEILNKSANYSYEWYKDNNILTETNSSITLNDTGTYKLKVTDASNNCDFNSNEIEIKNFDDIKDSIKFSEVERDIELLSGASITINVTNTDSIYTDRNGEEFYMGKSPILISEEGDYLVKAFAGNCFISKKYTVTNLENLRKKISNIFIPGEGNWVIPKSLGSKNIEVIIANSTGKILYRKLNYKNDWKGTDMKGNKLQKGVYYYFIVEKGKELINGSITIF